VEQQLPAGLGEGEISEFVEDDEVEAREIIGEPSLAASAAFGLELIDEIDGGEEATARSGADAASRDGDCQMRLARACSADQDEVALLGDEAPARKIAHQRLIDRRVLEDEVSRSPSSRWPRTSMERACLSDISAFKRSPTKRWGSCLRLSAVARVSS
jgi:hypothetical protein